MEKYIERILNSENNTPEIQELVDTIKEHGKVPIIYEILSNIKNEYFVDDSLHGVPHNIRVVLLTAYIGIKEGVSDEQLKLLLYAALYHDIGRKTEKGSEHGLRSAELIESLKLFSEVDTHSVEIIKVLCTCHNKDDKETEKYLTEFKPEDFPEIIKLVNILKDSDALDRVRLDRFGKLKPEFLRTKTAIQSIGIAEELFYESISIEDYKENSRGSYLIQDDSYSYFFRAIKRGEVEDREAGIAGIRTNASRYRTDSRFADLSEITIEEIYEHIRYKGRNHDLTRCISLTEDANVARTYNSELGYVIIRKSKDDSGIVDARKFFTDQIQERIASELEQCNPDVKKYIDRINRTRSTKEIRRILKELYIPSKSVVRRQYFNLEEELEYYKKYAIIKIMEKFNSFELIKGTPCSDVFGAIANAYTSAEYIHFGNISEESVIQCPDIFIEIISMLQQLNIQYNNKHLIENTHILERIITLVQEGFDLDENGNLSNGTQTYQLPEITKNIQIKYSDIDEISRTLPPRLAFQLTNGTLNYTSTRLQVATIKSFAESTLKKKALISMLQEIMPNENLNAVFQDLYTISPEFLTKQNGKGQQISDTVSILIRMQDQELSSDVSRELIKRIETLSDEELEDIVANGVESKLIGQLMLYEDHTKKSDKEIDGYYFVDSIIDAFVYQGRSLTQDEKTKLKQRISNVTKRENLVKLYDMLAELPPSANGRKYFVNELFSIILNIFLDGSFGKINSRDFMKMVIERPDEAKKFLLERLDQLQTKVYPISIDLLLNQGKAKEKLLNQLKTIGISEKILKTTEIKNIYLAHQIVKKFDWSKNLGRKITNPEQAFFIESLIDISSTKFKNSLSNTLQLFEELGIDTQDSYGILLRSSIGEPIIDNNGIAYSGMLRNSNYVRRVENREIKTNITEVSLLLAEEAYIQNRPEMQNKLMQELIDAGMPTEFINEIEIRNLFTAKRIVDSYDWNSVIGRELTQTEQLSLIREILAPVSLNKNGGVYLLSFLMKKLSNADFNIQEINGIIINSALGEPLLENDSPSYSDIIESYSKVEELKNKKVNYVVDERNVFFAQENYVMISPNIQESIMSYLEDLGVSEEVLYGKDIRNIYMALEVIRRYDWESAIGRKLEAFEEKYLIQSVVAPVSLKTGTGQLLSRLLKKLREIGLDEQTTFAVVIKRSIGQKVSEISCGSYTEMLNTVDKVSVLQNQKVNSNITDTTIMLAEEAFLESEDRQDEFLSFCKKIGVSDSAIQGCDIRNIYTAIQIVEKLDWEKSLGRKIQDFEKAKVIEIILSNASLKKSTNQTHVSTLLNNLTNLNIDNKTAYGIIIKLALGETIVEGMNTSYKSILASENYTRKLQGKVIQSKISEADILKIISTALRDDEQAKQSFQESCKALGVSEEIIEGKDFRNLYISNRIVEGYDWRSSIGRNLTSEEKALLIEEILRTKLFDIGNNRKYISFYYI